MKLNRIHFENIKKGTKVIESRLFDEKRKLIKIGDIIEFSPNDNEGEVLKTEVVELYPHKSFDELMSRFPAEYFGSSSEKEAIQEIHKFYSSEDENKYGVLGIRIIIKK